MKFLQIPTISSICEFEEESVEHLLLLCEWSRGIWMAICGLKIDRGAVRTFDGWLLSTFDQINQTMDGIGMKTRIAFTCWGLWKARNEAGAWIQVLPDRDKSWSRPRNGWIKVNVDDAYCRNSNDCGIGIVIRDSLGQILEAYGNYIRGSSAGMAEAYALREGVKFAVQNNFDRVTFEIDSLIVYNSVLKKEESRSWQVQPVVSDIQNFLQMIPQQDLKLISRTANGAADWFANAARVRMCFVDWRQQPSSSLVGIWNKDGSLHPLVLSYRLFDSVFLFVLSFLFCSVS
ncbi:hypothetical protein CCACVL1_21449 [Corchorus capsularis]|uniref:RNase H type-1 domain-containing protein n=1 Tax=Corchorus capsularis TaxID=210143 RepID=A0A1R3H5R1_COCAP|nr:hypothetical protein CCACVL1_21449 [Corchorus capsularis]